MLLSFLKGVTDVDKALKERCIQLDIRNIRIIKLAERLVNNAISLLNTYHPSIQGQAIQTLILLTWAKHTEDNAPTLEHLKNVRGKGLLNSKTASAEDRQWTALLDDYGFANMDEFDLELLNSVERGYFDQAALLKEATVLQNKIDVGEITSAFDSAWRIYQTHLEIMRLSWWKH